MLELTKKSEIVSKPSGDLLQLRHVKGESVFITDPENSTIEIKTVKDGTKIVFAKDENGRSIAIEERLNGTKLYHLSSDNMGLPSSHEIRVDQTEIVYFYNVTGKLQHFVELKPNGDRVSTVIAEDGTICSIEQRQIGGIIFTVWTNDKNEPKQGIVWLHPDGEISSTGDKVVVDEIFKKFTRFLDGVRV